MDIARHGDKVRITSGKYAGTIGTYDRHEGVILQDGTVTGNVHPGRNIEPVAKGTPDRNVEHGREIPFRERSQAMIEYERMASTEGGMTDAQMDAYNKKWRPQGYELGIPNRGLGRLLFGRNNTRFLFKRLNK